MGEKRMLFNVARLASPLPRGGGRYMALCCIELGIALELKDDRFLSLVQVTNLNEDNFEEAGGCGGPNGGRPGILQQEVLETSRLIPCTNIPKHIQPMCVCTYIYIYKYVRTYVLTYVYVYIYI